MSVHLDAFSEDLLLAAADFPAALAQLKALAGTLPDEFGAPELVRDAPDLPTALVANDWRITRDAEGNIVELAYRNSQTPTKASTDWWPDSVIRALAPAARRGIVRARWEDDPQEFVWRLSAGKVRLTRRKKRPRTPHPAAAGLAAPVANRPLGMESPGLAWRVSVPFRADDLPAERRAELAAVVVDALAGTGWWPAFTQLYRGREAVLTGGAPTPDRAADGGAGWPVGAPFALDPQAVTERVRRLAIRYEVGWTLTRSDGAVAVSLRADQRRLGLSAWAVDVALARLGSDAVDAIATAVGALAQTGSADLGRILGYARPVIGRSSESVRPGPGAEQWPEFAIVDLVDGRTSAVPASLPDGVLRSTAGPLTVLRWTADVHDPQAVVAAVHRRNGWLLDRPGSQPVAARSDRSGASPVRYQPPDDDPLPQSHQQLASFQAEFRFLDLAQWDLHPGRLEMIIDELAGTPFWPVLAGRGGAAREKIKAKVGAAGAMRAVHRGESWLSLPPGDNLRLHLTLGGTDLRRVGPAAVDAFVALVVALRQAFRGRAELLGAQVYNDSIFHRRVRPARRVEGYQINALVDIVDATVPEDHEIRHVVRRCRAIAAAAVPEDVIRWEHDGLVALRWLQDPSDVVAAARAAAAHEAWVVPLIDTEPDHGYNAVGDEQVCATTLSATQSSFGRGEVQYVPVDVRDGRLDEAAFAHMVEHFGRDVPAADGSPARPVALVVPTRQLALDLLPRALEAGFVSVVYQAAPGTDVLYWDPNPPGLWQQPLQLAAATPHG